MLVDDLFSLYKKDVPHKHTEESIIKILRNKFNQGYTYRISNAFVFAYDWECDFFCVSNEGYSFEFEVKISRADFKTDSQKYKHTLFKKTDKAGILVPNKFYYVVPKGLVTAEEIPKYAGLIYVGEHAEIVKRAPFLHKNKRDLRRVLCDKFYDRYIVGRRENAQMRYDLARTRGLFREIEQYLPEQQRVYFKNMLEFTGS
jgi:hypothetical protein